MTARITTNTPEEAATLLESLRTQGYSAEIIAPCEIEIQHAPRSSSSVGEGAPPIPLPVEQFVFSDYESQIAEEEQPAVREFVLMPLFRRIGVPLGNFSEVIQNAGHAAAFAFRDLLREMANRTPEAGEKQEKQLNLSPARSADWSAFREKLLPLRPEMLGILIASLLLTLLIVYGRHRSPPRIEVSQKAATGNALLAATSSPQPETPSRKAIVAQHLARPHPRAVAASTAPSTMTGEKITSRRLSHLTAAHLAEDQVIVHHYSTPKKNQVLAKGVKGINRYSDLE